MRSLILILFLSLSSCMLGPDYLRPDLNLQPEAEFINKNLSVEGATEWWLSVDDPQLQEWILALDKDNFALKAAAERWFQSIENSGIAEADFYPTLGVEANASRSQSVLGSFGAIGTQLGGEGNQDVRIFNNSYSLQLASSWQVDLFGAIRRNARRAEALVDLGAFEYQALRQSLIAELVRKRVAIVSLRKQVALSQQIISSRKTTLDSIQRRYFSGSSQLTGLDLRLAEENYATAQATLPGLQLELEKACYAIDILLGQQVDSECADGGEITLPPPEGIFIPQPAALMDRRPDLLVDELRLAAATESIGISIAELYPKLNISGRYGFQSLQSGELLDPSQIVWQIGGALTNRLFAGGKLRAQVRVSESKARELQANYLQSVLTALSEVEVALLQEKKLQEEASFLKQSVAQLKSAEEVSQVRYAKGLIGIVSLLDTQRRLAQLEQRLLNVELSIWNARVDLYLAVGGEWKFKDDQ